MLIDGITLAPKSVILNSLIEQGVSFPTNDLSKGRIFYLTADIGTSFKIGTYVYSGTEWTGMGSGGEVINVVKYDIGLFCAGKVTTANYPMATYIVPRDTYFEAHLPNSVARCKVPASDVAVYNITVDDAIVGTISFAAGSYEGVIAFEYDMLLVSGQLLELVGPATPDSTISSVGVTLVANVSVAAGVLSA